MPMTIWVDVRPESTPTIDFAAELSRHVRDLRPRIRVLKWRMALRIVPRCTDVPWSPREDHWWYRMQWVIPARCEHDVDENGYPRLSADCPNVDLRQGVHSGWHVVAEAGTLPMPPKLPTPEVTEADIDAVEQRQPGATAFLGGREKVRDWILSNTDLQWSGPPSSNQLNWETFVRDLINQYNELDPPRLTAEQRVIATAGRLIQAEEEVAAAKRSLAAQMQAAQRERKEAGTEYGLVTDLHRITGLHRATIMNWLQHNSAHGDVPEDD